ncbi:hypothetical protein EYF80_014927 [Liparis tanakae]|uniref:Uncharacterized protein n=1 Tax=Liparis tanakae TaxID=230148 RepID=A0A4Z2IA42_9TELE|nr:hypothetical protein EYF80_014927 [Liparis tanakae]
MTRREEKVAASSFRALSSFLSFIMVSDTMLFSVSYFVFKLDSANSAVCIDRRDNCTIIHRYSAIITLKQHAVLAVTDLFVRLEDRPEGRDLLSLGAEEGLELQHFFHEAFSIPLRLPAAAEPRVRHRTPLTTQVHRHLRKYRQAVRSVAAGPRTVHLPHELQDGRFGDEHVVGSRLLLGVLLDVVRPSRTAARQTRPGAVAVIVQGDSLGRQVVAHADVVVEVGQLLGERQQLFLGDAQMPLGVDGYFPRGSDLLLQLADALLVLLAGLDALADLVGEVLGLRPPPILLLLVSLLQAVVATSRLRQVVSELQELLAGRADARLQHLLAPGVDLVVEDGVAAFSPVSWLVGVLLAAVHGFQLLHERSDLVLLLAEGLFGHHQLHLQFLHLAHETGLLSFSLDAQQKIKHLLQLTQQVRHQPGGGGPHEGVAAAAWSGVALDEAVAFGAPRVRRVSRSGSGARTVVNATVLVLSLPALLLAVVQLVQIELQGFQGLIQLPLRYLPQPRILLHLGSQLLPLIVLLPVFHLERSTFLQHLQAIAGCLQLLLRGLLELQSQPYHLALQFSAPHLDFFSLYRCICRFDRDTCLLHSPALITPHYRRKHKDVPKMERCGYFLRGRPAAALARSRQKPVVTSTGSGTAASRPPTQFSGFTAMSSGVKSAPKT